MGYMISGVNPDDLPNIGEDEDTSSPFGWAKLAKGLSSMSGLAGSQQQPIAGGKTGFGVLNTGSPFQAPKYDAMGKIADAAKIAAMFV